ncbi:hypothetical protein D4R42_00395 [bacterium]|nr:MAG: hypothetical protein D4R42_00395 [bacterium]
MDKKTQDEIVEFLMELKNASFKDGLSHSTMSNETREEFMLIKSDMREIKTSVNSIEKSCKDTDGKVDTLIKKSYEVDFNTKRIDKLEKWINRILVLSVTSVIAVLMQIIWFLLK